MKEYDFDVMLHRDIRQGNEFDKLIPKHQNTRIDFERSDQKLKTTTFDSLIFMNQWVDKYHTQLAKVAPLLKGSSKAQTVDNIYKWLYNHFQYKLDTSPLKQLIYSPAAAWHHRKTGFDCKSFSTLASCLLKLLKIDNSFRMVKQKGVKSRLNPNQWIVNPEYWSHVYVIVPDGNKTLIIDATTHNNKEVEFVDKHDHKIMMHQGLNGAYNDKRQMPLGYACSCGQLLKNSAGNPEALGFAVSNFHKFLNELERNGISSNVTNNMLAMVRYNVERGIDPNMDEILQKSIQMSGQLGFSFSAAASQIVPTGLSNISVAGFKASDVTGAIVGDPGAILAIAKNIQNKLFKAIGIQRYATTFTAIFSDGFDLSCAGSTLIPATTRTWIEKDMPMVFNLTLGKGINVTNLNDFIDAMNWISEQSANWGSKMRNCSKKSLELYSAAAQKAKNQVIADLGNEFNLTKMPSVSVNRKLKFIFSNPNFNVYDKPYTSERFQIAKKEDLPTSGGQNPQNAQNPQNGQNQPATKTEGGINPLVVISAIGLAAKLLL